MKYRITHQGNDNIKENIEASTDEVHWQEDRVAVDAEKEAGGDATTAGAETAQRPPRSLSTELVLNREEYKKIHALSSQERTQGVISVLGKLSKWEGFDETGQQILQEVVEATSAHINGLHETATILEKEVYRLQEQLATRAKDNIDSWTVLEKEVYRLQEQLATRAKDNTDSWTDASTKHGSSDSGSPSLPPPPPLVNKWSQGNPFDKAPAGPTKKAERTTPQGTQCLRKESVGSPRKMKQILVRIRDTEERENATNMTSEELIKILQKSCDIHGRELVAVNGLKSGDLLFQTTTVEAREALERDTRWLTERYESAWVLRKSFPVMVHGVKISEIDRDG